MSTGEIMICCCAFIALIIAIVGYIKDKPLIWICGVLLAILPSLLFGFYQSQNILKEAELKIANGANVYVDGQAVDGEKIMLRNYDIEFKGKDVILSTR